MNDQQRAKIVSITLSDEQAKRIEPILDAHREANGGTHPGIEREGESNRKNKKLNTPRQKRNLSERLRY